MLKIGGVCEAAGSRQYKTGTWRDSRPEVNEMCNGCGVCELFCPDSCIAILSAKCVIDYNYCKGCGICANECARKAIIMREERK